MYTLIEDLLKILPF